MRKAQRKQQQRQHKKEKKQPKQNKKTRRLSKRKPIKIWFFGDTVGMHSYLDVPKDVDIACFTGNASLTKISSVSVENFLAWYNALNIEHKIFVPGPQDATILTSNINIKRYRMITPLIGSKVCIRGITFYGSPYTLAPISETGPYLANEYTLEKVFSSIPLDTDVLVTHCSPKGVLDIGRTSNKMGELYNKGSRSLYSATKLLKPKIHAFGHAVDDMEVKNAGSYKNPEFKTVFVNSTVTGALGMYRHNGIIMNV